MKIEIWSDIVCPFCYLGTKNLEMALEKFKHKDKVEIVYRGYQLYPDYPKNKVVNTTEFIAEKYGISIEQAQVQNQRLSAAMSEANLKHSLDKTAMFNTENALRLIAYAGTLGKSKELAKQLYNAYFAEGKELYKDEVLVEIAVEAGFDKTEVEKVVYSNKFADVIAKERKQAEVKGSTGVPFFLFDGKDSISGAETPAKFLETLNKSWNDIDPIISLTMGTGTPSCDGDVCSL